MTAKQATDTLIEELMKKLPPVGSQWPIEERRLWLNAAEAILNLVYGSIDQIVIQLSKNEKQAASSESLKTSNSSGRGPSTKRPAGIPSTFTMIQIVLDDSSSTTKGGLTLLQLSEAIAGQWWPGMHKTAIAADVSTWITKGRLA